MDLSSLVNAKSKLSKTTTRVTKADGSVFLEEDGCRTETNDFGGLIVNDKQLEEGEEGGETMEIEYEGEGGSEVLERAQWMLKKKKLNADGFHCKCSAENEEGISLGVFCLEATPFERHFDAICFFLHDVCNVTLFSKERKINFASLEVLVLPGGPSWDQFSAIESQHAELAEWVFKGGLGN